MGNDTREKHADLEVLSVFANAVFEECPDNGLTWWEFSHSSALDDYDGPDVSTVYGLLEEAKLLEAVPVTSTQHEVNAKNSGERLHPGVKVVRITEKGMKYFGNLISKELQDSK